MMNQVLHSRSFLLHLGERPEYDEPVLFKEPVHEKLTSWQVAQLHTEYVITRQIAHVPGIRPVYAIEGSESHPILLLEYIHGQSLAEIAYDKALDLRQKLQLAVEIAGILADIHEEGVIHGDITSHNILVAQNTMSGEPDGVTIIDFGLAKTMTQDELTQLGAVDSVAGSMAYVAPEQTSRIPDTVDPRSDLYSLGVTMYELFTGRLPFLTDDPLKMSHAHMATLPTPPRQCNAALPEPLSEIILKLMAKNADDRYQSAQGLGSDLVRCLHQLQDTGRVEPFELGQDDFSDRLRIPHKLYGRQSEISQLVTTYNRVAQGNTELLFVAGYSGVGKTSLVHEIRSHAQTRGGFFVEGKFDQLSRTLPYSAWTQAFNQLFTGWLADSDTTLARWRETILEAVGDHGQILIDIIPAMESIVGPQPQVPQLGGIENQNRLNYYFNRIIRSLATPEHPLVVFLDDLQWIDLASLNLIEVLTAAQSTDSFLIIGAYRDNEVGPDHPLVASQGKMRAEGNPARVLTLGDLAPSDVDHLLADTLQVTVADCRPVSRVLVEKTGGNPFYFRQLLYALESDGLLRFDRERRRWVWRDALHQSLQAAGNVVDLMISRIETLPVETQRNLSMAACIGSRFEASTLGTITGQPQTNILTGLSPALKRGLIVQSNGQYIFSHDRVQEAGYSLIPRSDLPKTHLEIGRLLLADTAAEDLEEEIFTIVGHLNAGRALIDKGSEKTELAALNLAAGQKANTASAYADAKNYIEIGLDLLGPDSWQEQYELTLALHNQNGELAYLTGQYDQVSTTAAIIHANAIALLDRVRICMTQTEAKTAQYNFAEALEIAFVFLRDLGFETPTQPTAQDNQHLHDKFIRLLTDKPMERLAQRPAMSDEKALAASSLFASVMSTAYIFNPLLFRIIGYQGAILTFEFGLDVWSPFFIGGIALVNIASIDRETPADEAFNLIQFCKQMTEIIREMLGNPLTGRSRTKGLMMLTFVAPWFETKEQGIESARVTYNSGYETGDWLYGSYGAALFATQGFTASVNLGEYQNQLTAYTTSLREMGQIMTPYILAIYLQTAESFKENSPEPHRLNGTYFNEDKWLPGAIAANDLTNRHFLSVNRLIIAYHFDVNEKLDEYVGEAEDLLVGGTCHISFAHFYLFSALSKLRLDGGSNSKKHPEFMNLVNQSLHWMAIWSRSVPSTFQHKFDLIAAEKARVLGDVAGALDHYEQAITGARENGFTHEEALANELYACFWLERDNERFASLFMREAYSLYRKWGALAKAEHLTERYPSLMIGRSIAIDQSHTGVIFDQTTNDLDIMTVLRTSQAIAGEIELDRLLGRLMASTIENSGAQLGFLLLQDNGHWMIVAHSNMDEMDPHVEQTRPVTESDLLSQRIVRYVSRTQQTVLLEDAAQSGDFVDDPHVQRYEVKSLFCTPMVNLGRTSAILYLENNLSAGVFTPDRVKLLRLLSSQMAISIDNARTRDRLEQLLEERSEALTSAEAQIHSIFDNSPLGIALSSYSGEFLTVNLALIDMLRISEEEALQRNVTDFYADPSDRVALLAEVQQSGSVQDFGVQLIRDDGTSFFASFNISRLVLGGNKVLLALVEDVTSELTAEQEIAALDERERLARELHDSVSQTLFSAGMIADAVPRLWDKDPTSGQENLELLSVMIRGASAEMRSLLLELRPDTLMDQTLGKLLETLAIAARARTWASISLQVEGDHPLPKNIILTLHRIAQESLNNIAKHAEAGEVVIDLSSSAERVKLCIKDDGRGFDPRAVPAGHLGVGIMRERAQLIGATFQIDSRPGGGTSVVVNWTKARDGETSEQSKTH